MVKLPVNLSKAMNAWKEVTANAEQSVSIVLAGENDLVQLAQDRFAAGGTVPATWVGPLSQLAELSGASGEILLVFTRSEGEGQVLEALGKTPPKGTVVLAIAGDKSKRLTWPLRDCVRVGFEDDEAGWGRVFVALAEAAGDRVVDLGRRHPAMRPIAARRLIQRTAGQNALIGVAFFLPGADMPAITLNQLKMLLYIAGLYGQELGLDRALELAGIIGMGFGFRGVARKLSRPIPGFGWIYRGIVGYTATVAVGMVAVKYFESGAPASADKLVELVKSFKS